MKFLTVTDKYLFLNEIERVDLFPQVSEGWVPSQELVELFIRKRRKLITGLKDFRKSQNSKAAWRKNRWKNLSGLRTFHRSTMGKRLHRELGRFNATRESYTELNEFVKALASVRTHALIEREYFHSLMEEFEYEVFFEELILFLARMDQIAICEGYNIDEADAEFLLRLTESTAQIKAFADASGKSVETVDKYWNEIKAALLADGKSEDDEFFYGLLVSILKKKLGLK